VVLSNQTCTNQALSGAKKKCKSKMGNLAHDLDEMGGEAKLPEEKAQRAMSDAARLADELQQKIKYYSSRLRRPRRVRPSTRPRTRTQPKPRRWPGTNLCRSALASCVFPTSVINQFIIS